MKPTIIKPQFVTRTTQAGKVIPLILIAVAAAAVGYFTFNARMGDSVEANASHTQTALADSAALAALQENLQTSLALPIDFKTVKEFNLLDVNGDSIDQSVFDDQWSLVFFGFTHCPDICPITLQIMKEVVATLDEQAQQDLQIIFVSVDPARDTPEVLKKYIGYFDENFVGITGDVNEVHDLTSSLGIVASFTANDSDPDNYGVDHTASLLLIDPQHRVRAKVSPPLEADKIVADVVTMTSAPS
ncbi:SCO family protein [bacterium]|nr:SCO family protein [bacterium]